MPKARKLDFSAPAPSAGRPSSYSQDIADEIERRMIEGETLVDICRFPNMPSRPSVYRWMERYPEFETRIARAREGMAELLDHEVKELADTVTAESAPAARVRLAALQWRASKAFPRRYGDRTEIVGNSVVTVQHTRKLDISTLSDDQLDALEGALGSTILQLEANKSEGQT
jgi:hypothetical protein